MKGPRPSRIWQYACGQLRLGTYFRHPGDGRLKPRIPAKDLVWSQVICQILREPTFSGVEGMVRSSARASINVGRGFSDDTLSYFDERMDPEPTRKALASTVKAARKNKAFSGSGLIGLAIDGTGAGHTAKGGCELCHPVHDPDGKGHGFIHHLCLATIVGTGNTLPLDVEPYGPGGSEYTAGQRLVERVVGHVGRRFLDYVVVDAKFSTAPFLHTVGDQGLYAVARLKDNLPELYRSAVRRFSLRPPSIVTRIEDDLVEFWDADDFDPWDTLRWKTVRVLRYRQHKPDGKVVEAYWLTDIPIPIAGSKALYRMAKARWEVENQGFNEAKNRHGLEHICSHHPNSLLVSWLLLLLSLLIERLFRLRFLHRGNHALRSAIDLVRSLRLWLGHRFHAHLHPG
jgi:hypothetical protein